MYKNIIKRAIGCPGSLVFFWPGERRPPFQALFGSLLNMLETTPFLASILCEFGSQNETPNHQKINFLATFGGLVFEVVFWTVFWMFFACGNLQKPHKKQWF